LNEDAVAMAGECLVDGVVRNLENHVVKARAIVGIADVHARAFAHRVEALEDLDRVRAIFILIGVGCHSPDIRIYGRKSRAHAHAYVRAHARLRTFALAPSPVPGARRPRAGASARPTPPS